VKNYLRAVLTLALLTGTMAAAEKPNFSGDWTMNAAKSDFGPLPAPTSITRKVTHTEPSLSIVEEQKSALGDQNTIRNYTTDGKDVTFMTNGAEVNSSAVWDGDAIVVTSKVDTPGGEVQFKDRMTVSEDGKVMTSLVHITSPLGEVDLTVVFDRQ
jgi:hypothetical protein